VSHYLTAIPSTYIESHSSSHAQNSKGGTGRVSYNRNLARNLALSSRKAANIKERSAQYLTQKPEEKEKRYGSNARSSHQ
jgi:hypothetical protein